MATLSLKISVVGSNAVKTMQFSPSTIVYDACKIIRERVPEANHGNPSEFGLFLADEDLKKGVWLESGCTLEYYLLRNGDLLEYKKKHRMLRVRMLDETVKTLQVDDSHTVSQLMITICSKIGIMNHEEYSLVRDLSDDEKQKTLTLKRDRSIAKDQKKLDEMKRKLHTDDELNWLDHSKTLREQGIDLNETLLLRRKFFFSDQNVDARDPVQLNLLYVQMRDAICKGAHPVSQEEAVKFAGLQCQIQFGDYIPNKHKSGFLDLKEFLPREYIKVKGIEKKIFAEHKERATLSEIDSKVKYTALARSLKTYGITFFLVKEKMKGKNKMVPRLLGITKDSIVRVDEKTKQTLKTWPLTTVRRWAASPNSFTLDFGDYSDDYYSVQTTEGEQISQLIAGYIDIIVKKKKDKDYFGIEGDEESSMFEDSVSPAKATIIQHQSSKVGHANVGSVALPAVLRAGDTGQAQYSTGSMGKAQYSKISMQAHSGHVQPVGQNVELHGLEQAQRALLSNIETSLTAVQSAQTDLEQKSHLPPLGSDPASMKWRMNARDMSLQNVGAQLSAMTAATAQVVTLTSGGADDTDYNAVGSAVATISSNIGGLTKDVKMLAALDETDGGDRLMDATRRLIGAFSDLLNAAQPGGAEPRQNMLAAASKIGEASHDLMTTVGDADVDHSIEEALLALAKAVANATAALVLKAKGVASRCDNQADQNKVIGAATHCALATSQLVACTKVVAPTMQHPACQDQLVDAAKHVAKSVDIVVETAQGACSDDQAIGDLRAAATEVSRALNDLLQQIKSCAGPSREANEVDTILTAADRLTGCMGDTPEMVRQARILAQATSMLVNDLQSEAESSRDSDQQKKLLAAAKVLADATAKMVEAAKGCASSPQDKDQQQALKQAAEDLRVATGIAASSASKKQIIHKLEVAAKHAASASTQLINASNGASPYNTNDASQQQLMSQCKVVADESIPKLVHGIKGTMNNPEDPEAQMVLIAAAQDMLLPGGKLLASAKAAVPTISDQAVSMSVTGSAKNLAAALAELLTATTKAQEACGSLEIDGALYKVRKLEKDLEEVRKTAKSGNLVPLPGETAEDSATQLGATSKTVGSSMAQLLTAAAQGNDNYTGTAARDTASALEVMMEAARGVAATTGDRDLQENILACAIDVMDKSANLIMEAKKAVNNPNNPDNQTRLAQVAKAVSQALNTCVNCLPGLREVDTAAKQVNTISQRLTNIQYPATDRTFPQVQSDLNRRAVNLNQAATDVVAASRGSPKHVAQSSTHFGEAYSDFIDGGIEMGAVTKNPETRTQIVNSLKSVSMVSSKLLLTTRSLLADPNAPNIKNLLAQAARSVTDSINQLINICTVSAPGQKECDNALRQMQMMRPLLDNPNEPATDGSYFDCLENVINRSRDLAEAMTGISQHAKQAQLDDFCDDVKKFANAVCVLTENSAQAAYLVGIADPNSQPGRPGLVDQGTFARANQAIQMACQDLTNPASTQKQVLSAATTVAKYTSSLCNICRVASSKTNNPVAKRHFVQSAKDVANSTANLVRAIKELDSDFSDDNRRHCADAAQPLIEAIDELTTFASSPEFTSVPAKISLKARATQDSITSSGKALVDGACSMIQAAKQLAMQPRDPPTYHLYSQHSHSVSDAIKQLVASIRNNALGQKECEHAISSVNQAVRQLDKASMEAMAQNLAPHGENSMQGFQDQMTTSARMVLDLIDPIRDAAKFEAEKLGHLVSSLASYFNPMTQAAIGCASKTVSSKQQMALLDQTKTVAECALQLLYAAKEGSGNAKAAQTHGVIDETADGAKEMLEELLQTLEDAASAAGFVSAMIETISKAVSKTESNPMPNDSLTYVDYQTSMVRLAKQIARTSQDMIGKSDTNVSELGGLANMLTHTYDQLASETPGAIATTPSADVANRIKLLVQQLGTNCVDLVKDAGNLQCNPTDAYFRRDLADHSKKVSEKVSHLLSALQAGSRGTQACINAASTVSGIIGDLDTTIMFATAGTLNAEGEEESFADHRENILKTAKALVEDTKTLVAGAASNQEQLANAAGSAVMTITELADCVKHGAASLGSEQPDAQVLLINAVKDVATALGELISATKNASGKSANDPAMSMLKDSAKVMVTNVTSLLKTVKTVEDEAARGTRALESSIEAISQEIKSYVSTDHVEQKISAEELVRFTKPITTATAKAVAAGNSCRQEDAIVAANTGRKAISDLLRACKGAAAGAETTDIKQRMLEAGRFSAVAYRDLLCQVSSAMQKPTVTSRQELAMLSKKVASGVTEIVHAAEAIKGSDWVDPNDPTVIAERELLGAANKIEAAARKLAQLQARKMPKQADESLNFDEQILEAAKSIAAATAALVKAASAAQRELIAQGKIGTVHTDMEEDSQWSEGLISAAHLVAAATHSLCDTANALVQGNGSEEKLISAAKQVASSTAHLLVACRVKADADSSAMRRLQAAGNAVKRATDALVRAAQQQNSEWHTDETDYSVDLRMVGGLAEIIKAKEAILIKERELETARRKLETIRRAKYKGRGEGGDDDEDSGSAF